jgi:hypothetical protein
MSSTVSDPCIGINGAGIAYREFSCEYPQLEPFYFEWVFLFDEKRNEVSFLIAIRNVAVIWKFRWSFFFTNHYIPLSFDSIFFFVRRSRFEKNYDPIPLLELMRYHSMIPVYAVILYGVLIAVGQYAMRNREPFNLRRLMAFWNLALSVFSWIGMFRTLPQLLHNLYHLSMRDNLCMDCKLNLFIIYYFRSVCFIRHLCPLCMVGILTIISFFFFRFNIIIIIIRRRVQQEKQ